MNKIPPQSGGITDPCRMYQLLRQVLSFVTDPNVMKLIYIQYIRGILERSCQVWAGSITLKNKRDLERIQKISMKIILPNMNIQKGYARTEY